MIGVVDVECQAANPNMPLYPMRAFVGSPSSLRLRNVPKRIGDWCIRSVEFTAVYPDGTVKSASCVLTGGVWVGTIEGTQTSGTSKNGYTIFASGTDENGNEVTGYVLGKGDIEILEADGTLNPDAPSYYVHLLSAQADVPKEGDLYPTLSGYMIWQGGEAHALNRIQPYIEDENGYRIYANRRFMSPRPINDTVWDFTLCFRVEGDTWTREYQGATTAITNEHPWRWVTQAAPSTILDITPVYVGGAVKQYNINGTFAIPAAVGLLFFPVDNYTIDGDKFLNYMEYEHGSQGDPDWFMVRFYRSVFANTALARLTDVPKKVSELTNDAGYISSVPDTYRTYADTLSSLSGDGYATLSALELKQDKLSDDQTYVIDREVYDLYTHIQTVGGHVTYTFKSPSAFDKSILIEQGILSSDGTTWIYPPVRVSMGSNVTFINAGAFQNATNLLSFDGENVGTFQANVFSGCTALRSVDIPNATIIGTWMFRYCTALKTITMPKSVTTISRNAFTDSSFDQVFFEGKTLAQVKAMTNYSKWGLAEDKIYTNAFENQLPTKTSELSNDSGFVVNQGGVATIVSMTQAQYDALVDKDAAMLYVIPEEV